MAREISTSEKIYGYISSNKMFCLFVFMICVLFAMFLHQQGRVTMAKKPAFSQQKYPVSTNISKGNNKNKKKKKKTCEAELLNKVIICYKKLCNVFIYISNVIYFEHGNKTN